PSGIAINRTKSGESLATVLVAAAIVAALYFGREVLLPIALAVLLSFVLAPPVRLLQRLYLPRFAAVTIVVLLAFGLISGIATLMFAQVSQLAGEGESGGEDTRPTRRCYGERDSRTGFPGAAKPAERTRSAKKRKPRFSCSAGRERPPG
ncbi:MAG TPA: AI-2E family transporter, partial [Pyrinomonadaceae bacterium]|nr:AI-2E family transporter [Pyrinomonadaceae bacterium]